MPFNINKYQLLKQELKNCNASLVAVSKTKPVSDLQEAYNAGVRDFGENYVQELCEKQPLLPHDIRWHFIGHLQSNKVKYIAPFVHLIHGVDSEKLLLEINKQGQKLNKTIHCLLQVHIASEETKFGMNEEELQKAISILPQLRFVQVDGLMGMASFSENKDLIKAEFASIHTIFKQMQSQQTGNFKAEILSTGMSSDYKIALTEGSNIVRIGSLLFGERKHNQ